MSDSLKPNRKHAHLFAIVRYESDAGADTPIDQRITVKKVVSDANYANREVDRLNQLNKGKGCHYFVQVTRLEELPIGASSPIADVGAETMPPVPQPQ